jgi:hypothetical protein
MMEKTTKKPYMKPMVIHEASLEVRAGSVIPPEEGIPGLYPPFPSNLEDQP